MQLIKQENNEQTMTSVELLKVINTYRREDGKNDMRHSNFMQKIRDELDEEAVLKFQHSYKGADNATVSCFLLPEDECKIMAMRESKFVRRKVIEYLKTLESRTVLPDFTNPVEAARAWADEVEKKQLALVELKETKEYSERQTKYIGVLEEQHAVGVTTPLFCKEMNGVNTQLAQTFLSEDKNWMHKQGGSWVASSYARDKYLAVKFKPDYMGVDRPVCYLTERGATLLYKYYCKGELPMKKTWNGKLTPMSNLSLIGTDED